jgi:uncharacterized protein YegL
MTERPRGEEERRRRAEEIEFADNPEQRCACVLLLDVSGSMHGRPIDELNKGIELLYEEISKDDLASQRVELAIVAFHDEVEVMQDFMTIGKETRPPHLEAGGGTEMCQAINRAMSMLEDRKRRYRDNGVPYYRPWLMLITDGAPNDRHLIQSTGQVVQQAFQQRQLTFFAIGTEDADFQVLNQLAPQEYPPKKLAGLKFSDLFSWLSRSLTSVSQSRVGDQVPLPPANTWASAPA